VGTVLGDGSGAAGAAGASRVCGEPVRQAAAGTQYTAASCDWLKHCCHVTSPSVFQQAGLPKLTFIFTSDNLSCFN